RPRLVFLDWLMGAFTMVVVAYALLPPEIFGVHVTLAQRLIAIRLDLLLPLLYLFGRVFWTSRRADLIWVIGTIVGSAAVVGVLFSVTRLAIALVVVEVALLALLLRRVWLFATAGLVAAAAVFMLYGYPQIGPLMDRQLNPVAHSQALHMVTQTDPSLREHVGLLGYDLEYVRLHPLGTGLGSAVHRFGSSQGTGESAVFDFF